MRFSVAFLVFAALAVATTALGQRLPRIDTFPAPNGEFALWAM